MLQSVASLKKILLIIDTQLIFIGQHKLGWPRLTYYSIIACTGNFDFRIDFTRDFFYCIRPYTCDFAVIGFLCVFVNILLYLRDLTGRYTIWFKKWFGPLQCL